MSLVLDAMISKLTDRPFNMEFVVTYKCNARCVQCSIWKRYQEDPERRNDELRLGEIQKIFNSYKGFKMIGITGGEPFLRSDLYMILDILAKTQPLKLLFIATNGSLPEKTTEVLERFCHKYPDVKTKILISIDGNRILHNKMRGINVFDTGLKTIKMLSELRKCFDNLQVGTMTNYSPFNFKEFDAVTDCIKNLNDYYDLESTFCFWSVGHYYRNELTDIKFRKDLDKYVGRMKEIMNRKKSFLSAGRGYCWDMISKWVKNPNKQVVPCNSGRIRYVLDPYGTVYPCLIFNAPILNLKDGGYDFNSVFRSNNRHRVLDSIYHQRCPICCLTCELIPSMMANPLITMWRSTKFWGKTERWEA